MRSSSNPIDCKNFPGDWKWQYKSLHWNLGLSKPKTTVAEALTECFKYTKSKIHRKKFGTSLKKYNAPLANACAPVYKWNCFENRKIIVNLNLIIV